MNDYALPSDVAIDIGFGWIPYDYLYYLSWRISFAILQGRGRLIIELPPRHGKSELISHWLPVWYIQRYPRRNIILATYESDFAISWGRKVKTTIQQNPRKLKVRLKEDSKAAGRWNTVKGGGMFCAGIGGAITGRGANLGIIDDPVKNFLDANSEVIQQRNIDWFNSTFYTRLEPNATVVILMTRWNENDLAGYLLKKHKDSWTEIRMPAIAEENEVWKAERMIV